MSLRLLVSALLAVTLIACSDDDGGSLESPATESQRLFEQFGSARDMFTQRGMQALLDYQDHSSPVVLVQTISVSDAGSFAEYEDLLSSLWESVGGSEQLASTAFAQMLGERPMSEARVVRFPNINALLEAIRRPVFTEAMELLYLASDDVTWVLGVEDKLGLEPGGSFFDPRLQGIDETRIRLLLGIPPGIEPPPEASNIINMLVSDSPSPFWMVNLIEYKEQAEYEDGRETDLTGREADEIYGALILPQLAAYSSLPSLTMDVDIVLSNEPSDWDRAAIVRYASRDAFLNIFALNPESPDALAHKNAGIENTNVYATEVPSEIIAAPVSGPLYNFRYCEVLLVNFDEGRPLADVYNSMGLGTCPQNQWDALDPISIAQDNDAVAAALNGPRFWVLDGIQNTLESEEDPVLETFGEIPMFLAASVDIAGDGNAESGRYQVNRVSRSTIFFYVAGRQVYELTDPDGTRYMMQSFTQQNDPNQLLVDLQFLGRVLDLPDDWNFNARILTENFQLPSIDGIAEVITDDLGNTYQRVP